MANVQSGPQLPSHRNNDASYRSYVPASSQVSSTTIRPLTSQPLSPAKAAPVSRTFFDPWNSSSTGHQRAENRLSGSTSWRVSRNLKLSEQYKGGLGGGGKRVADTVGAGSEDFGKDGRKANGGWEKGAKGLRSGGQKSLVEVWGATKAGKKLPQEKHVEQLKTPLEAAVASRHRDQYLDQDADILSVLKSDSSDIQVKTFDKLDKQIFTGLCFYINGSTAPLVSDHKLKHMLAAHGARHSIALGRRSVTHVLLGTVNAQGGAGGGLAATKIQKEISKKGGRAVKFITAEWVLESVKANRRLPESRFSPLKLAPQRQTSVFEMLRADRSGIAKQDQG